MKKAVVSTLLRHGLKTESMIICEVDAKMSLLVCYMSLVGEAYLVVFLATSDYYEVLDTP